VPLPTMTPVTRIGGGITERLSYMLACT
jgi:hypothetical protein